MKSRLREPHFWTNTDQCVDSTMYLALNALPVNTYQECVEMRCGCLAQCHFLSVGSEAQPAAVVWWTLGGYPVQIVHTAPVW